MLEFCLDCLNSNTIDASKAKAQAENIAKTFIDQYKFAFDSFVVGHKAKVQKMLNEYNEARKTGNQEKIEEAKKAWELAKSDANNEINILIEKAQGVQEQYDKLLNYIKSSEQAYMLPLTEIQLNLHHLPTHGIMLTHKIRMRQLN